MNTEVRRAELGRFAAAMNTEVGLPGLAGGLRGFHGAGAWFSGAGAVYTPPLIVSTETVLSLIIHTSYRTIHRIKCIFSI
jgi:hypothetical protein